MVPEDGETDVGIIRAGVVNMQPVTVAQLEICLVHHRLTIMPGAAG